MIVNFLFFQKKLKHHSLEHGLHFLERKMQSHPAEMLTILADNMYRATVTNNVLKTGYSAAGIVGTTVKHDLREFFDIKARRESMENGRRKLKQCAGIKSYRISDSLGWRWSDNELEKEEEESFKEEFWASKSRWFLPQEIEEFKIHQEEKSLDIARKGSKHSERTTGKSRRFYAIVKIADKYIDTVQSRCLLRKEGYPLMTTDQWDVEPLGCVGFVDFADNEWYYGSYAKMMKDEVNGLNSLTALAEHLHNLMKDKSAAFPTIPFQRYEFHIASILFYNVFDSGNKTIKLKKLKKIKNLKKIKK
ncbi:MAG: hypothetical protein NZ811_07585 [Gammaproteobacteria bacterium]|nr:hypothetical protein [Gammaproteobacteria bacterium]